MMSRSQPATAQKADTATAAAALSVARYAMLWRWHFYAALFVMPLLIVLGITGTIYLYKPQVEAATYKSQLYVAPQASPRLPQQILYEIAQDSTPGGAPILTAEIHNAPDRSAQFTYSDPVHGKSSIFLNPYSGQVLAQMPTLKANATYWIGLARQIHRGLLLGKTGEIVMELAACWTLIMIGTGVALWWPRRKKGARLAVLPDVKKKGRLFWREIHATLGIVLAAGAVFFVMSGLPWTSTWGAQFKQLVAQVNLGYPPDPPGSTSSQHEGHEGHGTVDAPARVQDLPLEHTAWGAGLLAIPQSASPVTHADTAADTPAEPPTQAGSQAHSEGHEAPADQHIPDMHAAQRAADANGMAMLADHGRHDAAAEPISLDQVMALAHASDIPDEYSIALPAGRSGVYSVSYYPGDPTGEKVMNVDQYNGNVINGVAYDQYGLIARIISFGVSLHMGTYFGWVNQLLCAMIALGLCAMAVTGFVMWWKRRPAGGLGAPRIPDVLPNMRGWMIGLALFGIVFPMTGLSMLAVWLLDRWYLARRRRLHGLDANTI
ncbi:PepSY domain-containing protein [Advenella sp. S44]|uniref:PepSY-associated TM helix domain-containing protein n=1 Tax=Advenella sp. S44 TaxID=1982755 RepID=UPI00137473A2|nr:PepSY domain-containing protein [Advenella sp. S44]